jgi:hypothetical protein
VKAAVRNYRLMGTTGTDETGGTVTLVNPDNGDVITRTVKAGSLNKWLNKGDTFPVLIQIVEDDAS